MRMHVNILIGSHVQKLLLLIALVFSLLFLSGCGAQTSQDAWIVYQAERDTLVNPSFPAYSFEYPSYWELEENANNLTFASEPSLLQDPPDKMEAGQIIAGLSINMNMPPEEMVETHTSGLGTPIQVEEPVSLRLNGRPAVYQQGTNPETGDVSFALAIDMGVETRGLLTARMAAGEFEKWEEVLFKMAGSLKVEP
jgi:hypothetical protein